MCVKGGLCVILSFERLKLFVIHESACVVNASSMRDYARDTRRPSVLMRRNRFETAHVHVRPLTPHLYITHEPRAYHVYCGTKLLIRGTFVKRACLDALRQWFMRCACVECSWNTAPYLLVCVDVRDISVIRQWLYMIRARFMRDLCVIRQWFLPPTPRHLFNSRRSSTHKPNQCVICE